MLFAKGRAWKNLITRYLKIAHKRRGLGSLTLAFYCGLTGRNEINMPIHEYLFIAGMVLCTLSLVALVIIQLKMMSKYGQYSALLKNIEAKDMRTVKLSGVVFLVGALIVAIGMVLRNAL